MIHPLPPRLQTQRYAVRPVRLSLLIGLSLGSSAILAEGPCDIYQAANTPCVAAHSTTRALYAAYNGALYQVRRTSDNQTKDIYPLSAGGVANMAAQDSFLNGKAGTVSLIYDQSPQKNNLPKSPRCNYLEAGLESDVSKGLTKLDGHPVLGIYITGATPADIWATQRISSVAYRNNKTKGIATGNMAEAMYAVVDGKRYSNACCFDYGNGETTGNDDGNGTMEAIYWGTNITWGGKGDGTGPWIAADLENGMFKADKGGNGSSNQSYPNDKTVNANFASLILKGPAANTYGMKAGDAQSGKLVTMWNGARPSPNYYPKKLQGAIFLGTGGDGSPGGTGTFFEGAMTNGNPPDSIDDKIQANIIAAGYGRQTTSVLSRHADKSMVHVRTLFSTNLATIEYDLASSARAELEIVDLRGERIAKISSGEVAAGMHQATWDASSTRKGVYLARLSIDGSIAWSGSLLVGQ